MNEILQQLDSIIAQRRAGDPDKSYVAQLHQAGLNKILEKIGEEATETIVAAKDADNTAEGKEHLVKEVADLWFHSLVLLSHLDLSHADVLAELERRFGIGGHVEKAQRPS